MSSFELISARTKTASLAGYPNCPAYTTAKHAIVGLTKCMALDFRGVGIRANCYCPASVDTAMVSKFWEAALFSVTSTLSRCIFAGAEALGRPVFFGIGMVSAVEP